jgi:hypothetical protein
VLDVQQEAIPSRGAEVLSRNCHVAEAAGVDVVTNLFEAGKDAIGASYNNFNCLVFTTRLLCLLREVDKDDADELDD